MPNAFSFSYILLFFYTTTQTFFSVKLSSFNSQCTLKENTTKRNAALFLDAI